MTNYVSFNVGENLVTILSIELNLHLELGIGLEGLLYLDQFV